VTTADTYVCEACGETYRRDPDWTDADARAELARDFPSSMGEDLAILCDDCYRALMDLLGVRVETTH